MKKFTPSQEHADRVVAIVNKWTDIPEKRPSLAIPCSKRHIMFAEVNGAPPWMYEQIIDHFLTVIRNHNERH